MKNSDKLREKSELILGFDPGFDPGFDSNSIFFKDAKVIISNKEFNVTDFKFKR